MDNPPNSSKLSVQDEKNEGRSWSNAVRLQHKVKWKKRKGIKGNNKLKVKSWYALLMGNASPACCTPAGLEQQVDWAAVPACFGNCSNTRTGDSSIILNHPPLFISAQSFYGGFPHQSFTQLMDCLSALLSAHCSTEMYTSQPLD